MSWPSSRRALSRANTMSSEPSVRQKIITELEAMIVGMRQEIGTKLPTERELARRYMARRSTVQRALRELERKGLVSSTQGRGRYVCRRADPFVMAIAVTSAPLRGLEWSDEGLPSARCCVEEFSLKDSRALGLPGRSSALCYRRLAVRKTTPTAIFTTSISLDRVPGFEAAFRRAGRLLEALSACGMRGVSVAHARITARKCAGEEVDTFNLAPHVPVLSVSTVISAAFANLEAPINPELIATLGLRYGDGHRRYVGETIDLNPYGTSCLLSLSCTPGPTGPVPLAEGNSGITDRNLSWRAGLSEHLDEHTNVYATVTDYEIGLKRDGQIWSLNTSLFYYDYKDIQTNFNDTSGGASVVRVGNVNHARAYGLDADGRWVPTAGLTLDTSVGLLSTKLGPLASATGVKSGNQLANAPRVTARVSAEYVFDLGSTLRGRLQLTGSYTGKKFTDANNTNYLATAGYALASG
jgi:DNA-binding GntR family transcriptional regulator